MLRLMPHLRRMQLLKWRPQVGRGREAGMWALTWTWTCQKLSLAKAELQLAVHLPLCTTLPNTRHLRCRLALLQR